MNWQTNASKCIFFIGNSYFQQATVLFFMHKQGSGQINTIFKVETKSRSAINLYAFTVKQDGIKHTRLQLQML